jgi:hypothetical protein
MSLRSMRKAARLAASDAPAPNAEEPIGYRERVRPRSKIIMRARIQDHHRVGVGRDTNGCSAHVHRSQRRLRNSTHSGRFRCGCDRVAADFAVPSVIRGQPAEVSILRLGGRRIDHERAT